MSAMPQPSIAEERTQTLRSRARAWMRDKLISAEQQQAIESRAITPWKRVGLILGIVFFVLALQFLGALFGFVMLLGSTTGRTPSMLPSGIVTVVVALAAAELLIRYARFFGTGIEAALWIGGLCSFIVSLPSQGKPEALLVFAAAAAISGWRVLNPLFGGIALILVAAYVAVKVDASWVVMLFCMAIAAAALVALGWRIERVTNENLFSILLLVMPLAGYVAVKVKHDQPGTDWTMAFVMVAVAAVILAMGVIRRGRVELLAGAVAVLPAVFEVQQDLAWAIQTKLIAGGIVLVAIGWTLSRLLRGKSTGFVVTPTALTRYDEAMQIAGTIAAAPPHSTAPAAPQRESGGGTFGGAGASGDF